ncbi:MAG: DUF6508 domain-containing protein [Desulfohalobiaceae bacterium]
MHPAFLSETASDFVQACYEENFVQPFDWNEWGPSSPGGLERPSVHRPSGY